MESAGPEQSPRQLVPRKACGEGAQGRAVQPPVAITHLLLLGSLSSMACDLSAPACNLPEGNAVGPTQGYRQHPDNPGENEQMALPQQDVGVAALS